MNAQLFTGTEDVDAVLENLLDELHKGLSFDRAAVYAYDEAAGKARQVAVYGLTPDEALLSAQNFPETVAYRTASKGDAYFLKSTDAEKPLDDVRAGAYIAVPIGQTHNTVGIVTLAVDQRGAFDAGDLNFVEDLARRAGAAIDDAARFETERKRVLQLGLINEIGKKAGAATTIGSLYTEIATVLKNKFNYYHVAIYSLEPMRRELFLETIVGGYANVLPVGFRQNIGEGLLGTAAAEKRTLLVNDVTKDSRYVDGHPRAMPTRSELCVPVLSRGDIVAVIDVQSRRFGAFDETDALALETLADQIGVLVENAKLFEEERRRADELALVYNIGRQILAARDIRALVRSVVASIRQYFKYYNVAVFLPDPEDPHSLLIAANDGAYETAFENTARVPSTRGFVGRAVTNGQLVYSPDSVHDAGYFPDPLPGEARSEVAIPIKIGDVVVGVLDVQENRLNAFTAPDIELLRTFADQMALAVQNVNLFALETRATHDAQTLLHISHIVSQTPDLEKSFGFLVEETAVIMNADGGALVLLDADGEPTQWKAVTGFTSKPETEGVIPASNWSRSALYQDIVAGGKPVFVPDAPADPRITGDLLPGYAAGALAAAPIRKKDRVLGILLVVWERARPKVRRADLELFEAIAFQAALGIENLLYLESLTRQTKYLSILSSVAADASRLPPLEEFLHVALQKILIFAGLDGGAIHLVNPTRTTLNLVALFRREGPEPGPGSAFATLHRAAAPELFDVGLIVRGDRGTPDPFHFLPPEEGGPATYISLPLVAKQLIHGRVTLWANGPQLFGPDEVALIQTICDELSIFIDNSQLFAQTSGQMKELLALLETTKALTSTLDSEEIIYSIAQKVKDLIGADECTVFLLDREAGALDPIVSLTAYPEEVMKIRLRVGEGITGHVALTGVGEYVNDALTDARSVTVPGTPTEEKESLLCVPLVSREEVIGVMTLGRLGGGVFTDRDLQLLTLFAGQVAGTIENTRLLDRLLSSISVAEEHRRKLDAIFTSISDPIIVTDTALRVIEINPAAEKMLGRKANDVVNRHVRSIIETPALHEVFENAQQRLESEAVAEFEFAVGAEGGTNFYRVLVDAVTGPGGEKGGFVATFRDVTEGRELALLKENFIANVGHELRTPLTSIIGSAELILDDAKAGDFPYYQFVTIINKEAHRLRELVESILDFSLLESGRLTLNLETVELRDIIEEAARRYRTFADEYGVTITTETRTPVPPTYADPHLLETILANLLKNGIKFNYAGGKVTVTLDAADGEAVIAVADTGPGIPADQLDDIFSKFYQVDGSSTRTVGGTGMGLAITKRAVEAHGGRVEVRSTVGQGATFTVFLPLRAKPPEEEPVKE